MTGTFAGAGANNPQPLSSAPPFGPASPATVTTSGTASTTVNSKTLSSTNVTSGKVGGSDLKTANGKTTGTAINVSSSDQLLSMLDGAATGPGGKITVPASKTTSNSRNSSGINAASRLNAVDRLNADRRVLGIRTASSFSAGRLPQ